MGDMADLISDEWDYSESIAKSPTCRYCGQSNLRWAETNWGWRLYNGSKFHTCWRSQIKSKGEKLMTKFKSFWILWQPDCSLPPKVRFSSKRAAQDAAEVMTSKHKVEFYVMRAEAVCQICPTPIKWINAKEN